MIISCSYVIDYDLDDEVYVELGITDIDGVRNMLADDLATGAIEPMASDFEFRVVSS